MLEEYRQHLYERKCQGIGPKPLDVLQVRNLIKMFYDPPLHEKKFLKYLLMYCVPSGVDEAAYIKAKFLFSIANSQKHSCIISDVDAVKILGTMEGGYNIKPLIDLLDNDKLAHLSASTLSNIILMFDHFEDVRKKAINGNVYAQLVMKSWSNAEWFFSLSEVLQIITVTVFKVSGETTTDDLSPATDAWSRTDVPLHSLSMLKNIRDGVIPNNPGVIGPLNQIHQLKSKGYPLAYVGDVIGTGSSRKSAVNSLLWFIGHNVKYIPNKKIGGVVLGKKIAPIFFNTLEDSGALPIETDVNLMQTGDIIDIYPYKGEIRSHANNKLLTNFKLKTDMLLDEVRSGGRIKFIIGRSLTSKARKFYGDSTENFLDKKHLQNKNKYGYSLAQKIVGRACGVDGIYPGEYCEPIITSVGSQDTTGPMTRDELKELGCLNFSADLVLQSFCHTAAYPKEIDLRMQHDLPNFIISRGGVSLFPGDGIIHSWLNRMILPDTVGTGADSHTRFPIGISFPAASGLVAFAATTGTMPLDMPESVLVRFSGKIQPGITLRDIVNSIPFYAIKQGLLNIDPKNKKNIFSGRILEIEGLPDLKVEQAFELTDSSAERSAAACVIKLNIKSVIEHLNSNVILLKWLIENNYGDKNALKRRIVNMEKWLSDPKLITADKNAKYESIIDINVSDIKEPILCIPNDPDNVCLLSEIENTKIDEVFIGSCMTNIMHFRTIGNLIKLNQYNNRLLTKLWIAPPTKMDAEQLIKEGYYKIFDKIGAQIEIPGCSLCMGNQARVTDGSTVVSTSTRNFPNRLGNNANVFLASAELSVISALIGKLPTTQEYFKFMKNIHYGTTEMNYTDQ